MSVDLVQRVEKAKQAALDKGTVIKMRKEDVLKNKILGYTQSYEYTWYQTPTKVGIEIPFSIEKKEDLKIEFKEDRARIEFPIPKNGGYYKLDLILFKKINRVRSKHYVKLNSIEVVMEKKVASENWSFLRRDGLGIPESMQESQLNYPSSAKVKHNWDKFDKEIEGDILDHYEDYGIDAGSLLFKQIYQNGDEEKRRAMMKSFQTSGGTVLSTDWNDVSNKDYEGRDRPEAPGGQEWRKPEY
jgi:suppressor of G2 allele of SKP1